MRLKLALTEKDTRKMKLLKARLDELRSLQRQKKDGCLCEAGLVLLALLWLKEAQMSVVL